MVLIMYLELAVSLQLQLHFGGRTVAALYKLGGDPRPIVMQVAGAQLLAPAPLPPAVSSRSSPIRFAPLSSPKELKHTGDQSPAPEEPYQPPALKIWVQLVTDNQALGEPTQIKLDAQSNVDDLCSEVHAKFPQLTGISAAELIVSWEGAPLDPSNQWRRDAPLTDVRTTCDSPLYIHAPTTEVRRPAHTALHLARVAPGARTRGAARAIPCPPQPCTPPALLPRRRFCHVAPPRRALLADWPRWTRCELMLPGCIPCRTRARASPLFNVALRLAEPEVVERNIEHGEAVGCFT